MKLTLLYHETIKFAHAFVFLMLHQINVDKSMGFRPKFTIEILLDLKRKLDKFEKEIAEAFEQLVLQHHVRDDFYEKPLPSLGLSPVYFIVKDPSSIQARIMEVFHKADRLIVAYSEVLENFDHIGIPDAADWSDSEMQSYYYDFMDERDRWIERTRVVLNKIKKASKPLTFTAIDHLNEEIDRIHEEMIEKSLKLDNIDYEVVEIIRLQEELFVRMGD